MAKLSLRTRLLLRLVNSVNRNLQFDAKTMRASAAQGMKLRRRQTSVGRVRDVAIPADDRTIPARLYQPDNAGPYPLLVFMHGGGWVVCDLETHDEICRTLCKRADCAVLSVDYRLAPEHKFPAGADDCFRSLQWAALHANELEVDPQRIAIAGDSAGGNLAAATALRARDEGITLCGQLLFYPVIDHYHGRNYASMERNANGYLLTRSTMQWFWDQYLATPQQADDPYASPLRASSFANLAPAFVITADYDPLLDEGKLYSEQLTAARNLVRHKSYNTIHGFLTLPFLLPEARTAIADACEWLKLRFA